MKIRLVTIGVVVALVGTSAQIYNAVIEWQSRNASELIPLTSPFIPRLQLFLISCFLVTAIGLLVRRKIGLVVSILALIGVLIGHLAWYAYTNDLIRYLEKEPDYIQHPERLPSHLFGLGGARWWDIAILLCSVTILIWEVKMLNARRRGVSSSQLVGND